LNGKKAWIGADPGMSGAVACMDEAGNVEIIDMPKLADGTLDHWLFASLLSNWEFFDVQDVVIEKVNAMPKQGVTSSFSFGDSFGALKQAIASAGWHFTLIRPATWKLIYGLRGGRENKAASVAKAIELFPSLKPKLYGPRGGIYDGRAEAALLAHYGSKLQ
jgi:hypothetical protein